MGAIRHSWGFIVYVMKCYRYAFLGLSVIQLLILVL